MSESPPQPEPEDTASSAAREQGVVARRAGIIALGTLSSRLLGACRDMVVAATFAVAFSDAFWLAFTIPNALRVLLGEGAVSAAFVPEITRVRTQRGQADATAFFARLAGAMGLLLLIVSLVGVLTAPWLVRLYASGFAESPELFERTVSLTRLVFPYVGIVGIASLVMGALHASKRFVAASFAPAMLNVGLITAALFLAPWLASRGEESVYALVVGALAGGILHVLFQLPSLRAAGYLVRPRLALRDPDVRRAFRLLAPILVALGVYQMNIIASRQLASYLEVGAISYLFYGQRLVEIPQGMFALAIGSAALPTLAEHAAKGDLDKAKALFRRSLSLSLFVAIPSTVGLAVLAEPFVANLFGRGAFGPTEVAQTAHSLMALAVGIWAVAAVRTIVPMFHSLGDTRSPVYASGINLVVFFTISILTMKSLGHVGLAIAISAAAAAQLIGLLVLLRRRVGALGLGEVFSSAARALVASAAMGLVLWQSRSFVEVSEPLQASALGVGTLAAQVVAGAVTFLAVARLARSPELEVVLGVLRRRVRRS